MPTDTSTQTIEVPGTPRSVLGFLRKVGEQPEWIPEVRTVSVLETTDDGLPLVARFTASAPVGSDEYTLRYEHTDHTLSWSMVSGRLQTGQEGCFTVEPSGRSRTRVTYQLTIHHNLPLPSFVRGRVIRGLVADTVKGLATRLESGRKP